MGYNLLGEREPLNCFICLRKESEVRVLVHATEVALGHFDPDQELWFPHNCICEECARKVMQIIERRAVNRGVIMMTHYILTERDEDGSVIVHFGPFASQDAAMNYVESERRNYYGDFRRGLSWSVDPLERPPTNRGRRSRKELLLLGWQGSTINPHHPDDVAAQSFSKTINLDGSVDRED